MTNDVERLRAARMRIAAAMEVQRRRVPESEAERAAQLLCDLSDVLEAHGVSLEMISDRANVPVLALDAVDARLRREFVLAAITDGPWSMRAGLLTEARSYLPPE